MKKYLILLVLISISSIPTIVFAADYQIPTLAVVSFENHSKVKVPDLENIGLTFLESALSRSGIFTLLDRRTIQKSLEEIGFNSASGLVDPSFAIQLGKMLGARYLATGEVIDITERVTEFRGYGIYAKKTTVSVTVGLRIVDAERGTIFFIDQNVAVEELPIETTNMKTSGEIYCIYQNLMKQAILKSIDGIRQKVIAITPEAPKTPKMILVSINSEPIGADVEINGIFYGNTPCELPLEEGKVLEITISLGGYNPWTKKVLISPALKINAKLNKSIPSGDSSNLNINIGVTSP